MVKLTDVKDEAASLVVIFGGGALAVYLEMSTSEQKSAKTIR